MASDRPAKAPRVPLAALALVALSACGEAPPAVDVNRVVVLHAPAPVDTSQDADRDGIPLGVDRCPDRAEDIDGWVDGDGCPDKDDDQDGIPDDVDRCPRRSGGPSRDPAEHGCVVQILEPPVSEGVLSFFFAPNERELSEADKAKLRDWSRFIAAGDRIEVVGYASGDEDDPDAIGVGRAESARTALVAVGIPEARISIRGATSDTFIPEQSAAGGRYKRRVEMRSLEE